MKTIYRIFKSVGLALIALWMVSCQDLLTEDPKGQLAVTNFFNSKGDLDLALNGMYSKVARIFHFQRIRKFIGHQLRRERQRLLCICLFLRPLVNIFYHHHAASKHRADHTENHNRRQKLRQRHTVL